MRSLFYQIRNGFTPTHFIVMGRHENGSFEPLTFSGVEGAFFDSYPSVPGQHVDEAVELYDKETAMKLLGHHAINRSNGFSEIKLFPAYMPQTPKLYMIFGKHHSNEDDMLTPLYRTEDGFLSWAKVFDDSQLPDPELFDLQTAEELVRRQKKFQEELSLTDSRPRLSLFIIQVCMPSAAPYNNAYLNPSYPIDGISQAIKETSEFCRNSNPEEPDGAWHLPDSLGGVEIVPAFEGKNNFTKQKR